MVTTETEKSPYTASFTAGSLLHKETTALLTLLQADDAEIRIREEIKNNELLHINSESGRNRIVREVIKRIEYVDRSVWSFYASCSDEEQKMLLFYVCLKTYLLMFDFHFNVTVRQWNSSSRSVDPYFYQMELGEIAARDAYVDGWKDLTKQKAISVYLRILKDVKLLNANNELQSVYMNDRIWKYFVQHGELWFLDACLLSNQEKERIIIS